MIEIYSYLDYHEWLSAAFKYKKALSSSFSHRFIASRLGLKSSGFFLYVMQGKRNINENMAVRIAKLFKLSKPQTDYFLQMIRYCHAKTSHEKQFQFERLIMLRRRNVKNVESEQYRFYEKWFYPVIREAIGLKPFAGDFNDLASMIIPPVTVSEAKEAIELLKSIGMIDQDKNGVYHKRYAVISTGDVWHSAIIRSHQHQLLERGVDALETTKKADRDISHLTITASETTMKLIRQRITDLRAEILEIARNEKETDRVLQCNFMVFPVAQNNTKKSK